MAKTIYRSDQVGRLLRPPRLLDARDAFKAGKIDQLALTSQCGFQGAATRDGAHVDEATQWRKIELIAEVSREVWQ